MTLTIPVIVLGLERNFRGEELVKRLKQYFSMVHVFYGFDAYSSFNLYVNDDVDKKLLGFLMHRKLSQGEIGCAISHKMIYDSTDLVDSPSYLILEDDCIVSDFPKFLNTIESFNTFICSNPNRLAALQLGSLHFTYSKDDTEVMFQKAKFPHYGTFAYLLSQSALLTLKSKYRKICSTADWPIWALELDWYKPTFEIAQTQFNTSTILSDREILFTAEERNHFFLFAKKIIRYLLTILGIRISIAIKNGISAKLIWKWDVSYKIWRKMEEKRIMNQRRRDFLYE